jgi:hypothetical protein
LIVLLLEIFGDETAQGNPPACSKNHTPKAQPLTTLREGKSCSLASFAMHGDKIKDRFDQYQLNHPR